MKRSFGIISLLLAVGLFLATGSVSAQTVAEWQFDEKADAAAGAIVKLNVAADGASVESKLMSETVCKTGSTGIGNQWKAFLHSGYLDVGAGVGEASKDKFGLTTVKTGSEGNNAEYRKYLGFSGLGKKDKDQGGTVYLVVQPKNEWKGGSRRGLSGTGFGMGQPYSSGAWSLWIEGGKLRFRVGRGEKPTLGGHTGPVGDLNGDGDDADFVYAESDVEQAWNPAKWYFVAASWQEESAPVLYVREMSAEGPAASPAAVKGEPVAAGGNVLAAVPAGSTGPRYEPLVVGARWINAGVPQTQDGADARIAYARFDKGYVTIESMNKVFESLAASAAETQAAK